MALDRALQHAVRFAPGVDAVLYVEAHLLATVLNGSNYLAGEALELQVFGDHGVELDLERGERDLFHVELLAHDGRDVLGERFAGQRDARQRLPDLEAVRVARPQAGLNPLAGACHVGLDLFVPVGLRLREIAEVDRLVVGQVAVDGVGDERRERAHQLGHGAQRLIERLVGGLLVLVRL